MPTEDHLIEDPEDERGVMARTAGGLWLVAAAVGLAGLAVPGVRGTHVAVLPALLIPVGLHGLTCLVAVPWTRVSIRVHAISSMLLFPLIGVGVWATGGSDSYIVPLLFLAALFIGYFYPPRWSWPLQAELVLVVAAPLYLDTQAAIDDGYLAFVFSFAAAAAGMNAAVGRLKGRLVTAERRQRTIANRDPLTGVANRRAFDAALALAARREEPFALLFVDLDDFKGINDTWGHPVGDRVLREIAAHCSTVVREGDCLARIGGDEFAVVAPGAGREGAKRLAAALERAVAEVRRGDADTRMRATVTAAVHPDDGATVTDLMHVADEALHALKRARRPVAEAP